MHKLFAAKFASKTRDEWTEIFAGTDACVTPVLTWREAAQNEHLRARSTMVTSQRRRPGRAGTAVLAHAAGAGRSAAETTTPIDEINW